MRPLAWPWTSVRWARGRAQWGAALGTPSPFVSPPPPPPPPPLPFSARARAANQAEEEDKMIDDVFSQLRLEEQAKQAGRAGPALVGQAQAGMLAGPMMAVPLGAPGGAQPPPALPCLKCGQYGHSPL